MARRSQRLLAYLLDFSALYIISRIGAYFGAFLAVLAMTSQKAPPEVVRETAMTGAFFGMCFWNLAAWFLNYGILQGLGGSSFGKLVSRIRVVNSDGTSVGILKSIGRTLCYSVSALPLFGGFIVSFLNPRSMCLHDMICGTVVVPRSYVRSAVDNVIYLSDRSGNDKKDIAA